MDGCLSIFPPDFGSNNLSKNDQMMEESIITRHLADSENASLRSGLIHMARFRLCSRGARSLLTLKFFLRSFELLGIHFSIHKSGKTFLLPIGSANFYCRLIRICWLRHARGEQRSDLRWFRTRTERTSLFKWMLYVLSSLVKASGACTLEHSFTSSKLYSLWHTHTQTAYTAATAKLYKMWRNKTCDHFIL